MPRDVSILIAEIPGLRRYAHALTSDPDMAEDLVQDCLERAVARLHQWRPERRLRPWLFAILHNLHVDMRRRVERQVEVPLDGVPEQPSGDAGPDGRFETHRVLAAIDRLPPEHRDVVLLVGLNELSYAEAAEVLGIPPGTLMSRLHRARGRLREEMGRRGTATIRQVL